MDDHDVDLNAPDFVLVTGDGEPVDLEALAAQAKPLEKWTLEEMAATHEALFGPQPTPDPSSVEHMTDALSRAFPEQAPEIRRVASFVLRRHKNILFRRHPLGTACAAPRRQQRREHHPRRRVGSSPRRPRAPGRSADDDPEDDDAVLAAAVAA